MGTASRSAPIALGRKNKLAKGMKKALKSDTFPIIADMTISLAANLAGVDTIYSAIKAGITGYRTYQKTGSVERASIDAVRSFVKAGISSGAADMTVAGLGGTISGSSKIEFARKTAKWAFAETYNELLGG